MTTSKIGPREQQLRTQREQQAKDREAKPKTGRPRSRQSKAIPEKDKHWRQQLRAVKANAARKDRRK